MPGSMTDYLENKVLEHIMGKTAYPMPTVYVALYTGVPTEAGGVSEIIGGGYARVQATFGAATGGSINNNQNIVFPAATANWGEIVGVGLVDSPTVGTGNVLWHGTLDIKRTILSGDQFVLPTNILIATLD
jgi:hypothetical protein